MPKSSEVVENKIEALFLPETEQPAVDIEQIIQEILEEAYHTDKKHRISLLRTRQDLFQLLESSNKSKQDTHLQIHQLAVGSLGVASEIAGLGIPKGMFDLTGEYFGRQKQAAIIQHDHTYQLTNPLIQRADPSESDQRLKEWTRVQEKITEFFSNTFNKLWTNS